MPAKFVCSVSAIKELTALIDGKGTPGHDRSARDFARANLRPREERYHRPVFHHVRSKQNNQDG